VFWLVILLSGVLLWSVVKNNSTGVKEREVNFSQFLAEVDQGKIKDVTVYGPEVRGDYRDEKASFHTTVPPNYTDMYKSLRDKGVNITVKDVSGGGWPSWLFQMLPLVVILGLWFFMIRQMQTGGNKALSFGKSRARLLSMQQKKITFKDVAGVDEAKEELLEIIDFLKDPKLFQRLGINTQSTQDVSDESREEAIAQSACKAAVKARDKLSLGEIERLVIAPDTIRLAESEAIGRAKREAFIRFAAPYQVHSLRAIKGALVPDRIFNPGKVI